jgi:hypothetical protein
MAADVAMLEGPANTKLLCFALVSHHPDSNAPLVARVRVLAAAFYMHNVNCRTHDNSAFLLVMLQ